MAAQYPVGSYPLYTLVTFILGDAEDYGEEYVSESIPGHELLACLKILVKQGMFFLHVFSKHFGLLGLSTLRIV